MRALALAAISTALAAPAAAQSPFGERPVIAEAPVCGDGALEPAAAPLRDDGLDAARSACGETALRARTRAAALIDTGDFYGTLAGALWLTGRWLSGGGIELELTARLIDYRFAQNAVITAGELSTGPLIAGVGQAARTRLFAREARWGPQLRLEVPRTATGLDLTALSVSPAVAVTLLWSQRVRLHARGALLLWAASPASGFDTRGAAALSGDLSWRAAGWLALTGGLEAQAGWRGEPGHLLGRGAIRFGGATGFDLAAAAPVPGLGGERTDLVVTAGIGRRF